MEAECCGKQDPLFINVSGYIFNVRKIQAVYTHDEKNQFNADNGVYSLHVVTENEKASLHLAYSCKDKRDADFQKYSEQLAKFNVKKYRTD